MQINSIGIASNGIAGEKTSTGAGQQSAARFQPAEEAYTTLSTEGPAVDVLVSRAMHTASARETRVQELRMAVNQGTYSVDSQQTASAMLRELAGQG